MTYLLPALKMFCLSWTSWSSCAILAGNKQTFTVAASELGDLLHCALWQPNLAVEQPVSVNDVLYESNWPEDVPLLLTCFIWLLGSTQQYETLGSSIWWLFQASPVLDTMQQEDILAGELVDLPIKIRRLEDYPLVNQHRPWQSSGLEDLKPLKICYFQGQTVNLPEGIPIQSLQSGRHGASLGLCLLSFAVWWWKAVAVF